MALSFIEKHWFSILNGVVFVAGAYFYVRYKVERLVDSLNDHANNEKETFSRLFDKVETSFQKIESISNRTVALEKFEALQEQSNHNNSEKLGEINNRLEKMEGKLDEIYKKVSSKCK